AAAWSMPGSTVKQAIRVSRMLETRPKSRMPFPWGVSDLRHPTGRGPVREPAGMAGTALAAVVQQRRKEATMTAEVWKRRDVAAAFLDERSLLIPDRQRQVEVLLRLIRSAGHDPCRILDLGAGDAVLLATALEAFPGASGVALDFSPLMLE